MANINRNDAIPSNVYTVNVLISCYRLARLMATSCYLKLRVIFFPLNRHTVLSQHSATKSLGMGYGVPLWL
jgi:hypothetical protein